MGGTKMNIAIKRDATEVGEDGRVVGLDAGATLVRRFLRLFPDAQLIGSDPRQCAGFEMVPLDLLDPLETIIINMDVTDSPQLWEQLYLQSGGDDPQIMNFVWFPVARGLQPVQRASLALSCALFPTFANSQRVALDVKQLVADLTVPSLAEGAQLGWVNLGFRVAHVQRRQDTDKPVVLYPAIYLSGRKRPDMFLRIVDKVSATTPLEVQMNLEQLDLEELAPELLAPYPQISAQPLYRDRAAYYDALSRVTAFLATSTDEAYGLTYVEALGAGAVGVFPDLPWARELLPQRYPFLYKDEDEATAMLAQVVADPQGAAERLDLAAGGSFAEWLRDNHNDDAFDREVRHRVTRWFPD